MKNLAIDLTETHSPLVSATNLKLPRANDLAVAKQILREVMSYRRIPHENDVCENADCSICASMHLPKIMAAVKQRRPVTFVLPAFPGKSPNRKKVLGHLPDHAEFLALDFLAQLCAGTKQFYDPGMKIILCSDGRVFSDVVGMKESHVTEYQNELDKMIRSMSDISTFNLENFYGSISFAQMRDELMKDFGMFSDFLKQKIHNGSKHGATQEEKEANSMYRGITRFLFEDSLHPLQEKSRTAIQKESRIKAYEVIRRSNAWSELIAQRFPEAVRLSIHPQTCGSKKLGIRLIGKESWMTPWHGAVLETREGFALVKRAEAEALGAELLYANGRPSHFRLTAQSN